MNDELWRDLTMKMAGRYIIIPFIVVILCTIMSINVGAETEDQALKVYTPKEIYEPFWEWRFGTQSTSSDSGGSAAYCYSTKDVDCGGYTLMIHKSASLNVYQTVKWNQNTIPNQDYGTAKFFSHKNYINLLTTTGYIISLSSKYYCTYWQTGSTTILKSYYQIVGYDTNDQIVSIGDPFYVARYDTDNSYYTSPSINSITQGGTATYSISTGSSVSYFRIQFVIEGDKLISSGNVEGIEIYWTETVIKYNLFSGSEATRGNSYVSSTASYPDDGYITLNLRNGASDSFDYGTVRAWTPFLNINNIYSSNKGIVGTFKIDYVRDYWHNSGGGLVFKGYFSVFYYDISKSYLGSDIYQWIDWDTTVSPQKSLAPQSSGTIDIPSPSTYNAKYIKVEVKLSGSQLYTADGATITFSNLQIAGGRQYNTEVLFYGEAEYDSCSCDNIPNTCYYDLRWQLLNNADSHLYTFYADFDDVVDSSDFTGTNVDDVRSNDFVIIDSHGGRGEWDTYLHLTNGQNIDDENIGDFGEETEVVCLLCCNILGNNDHGSQQRTEWAEHGLYKNHGLLGFYDESNPGIYEFHNFIAYLRAGQTFSQAWKLAFPNQPWVSIWDTESQMNYDKLWDSKIDEYGWQNDETSNDDTYWTYAKWQ